MVDVEFVQQRAQDRAALGALEVERNLRRHAGL
jgi:hypothetical protein